MSQHLITTKTAGDLCPRCQALTLTGYAEGLHARVDPTPITPRGELAVLLTGRATYTLSREGLIERDADRIAGRSLHGPVLPAHRCGQPIPAEHHAPPGVAVTQQPLF